MHELVIQNGTIVDGTGAPRFVGDIAIDGGYITAVGEVGPEAAKTIDARGMIITPGFVDIHTHYDGQVTWDQTLSQSNWHGVTTVVFGNCGVGFAPVHPDGHDEIIKLMSGVEGLSVDGLHAGIPWGWVTFPEYLDHLSSKNYIMDVGAQVPHSTVRTYVMGDRAWNQPATPEDIKNMSEILKDSIQAGALGFSTSRTTHRSSDGRPVPSRFALEEELLAMGKVMGDLGAGTFEVGSAHPVVGDPDLPMREQIWLRKLARDSHRPVTFTLTQNYDNPDYWKGVLNRAEDAASIGATLRPQTSGRPINSLISLAGSHPFARTPFWREQLAGLDHAEKIEQMADPQVRRRLIEEARDAQAAAAGQGTTAGPFHFTHTFLLSTDGKVPDYEPAPEVSVDGIAAREGRDELEVIYDLLMQNDGKQVLMRTLSNYVERNADVLRELLKSEFSNIGLSDAGAHVRGICDASIPTYLITHWTRDRWRGPKLPLEFVVKKQTLDTATLFGLNDRGAIKPGFRADINVIDYDNLQVQMPTVVYDLPGNGQRWEQRARGYKYTIVKGEVTIKDDEMTGAMPGRLVKGEQHLTNDYRQAVRQATPVEVA